MNIDSLNIDKIKDVIINNKLQELIKDQRLNSAQIKIKKQELELKIKAKQLITNIEYQSGITNAVAINNTLQLLDIDLLTTFGCVNELDNIIDKHIELNNATINNIKSEINKANDDIDSFEAILSAKGNPSYHIEGFRNANNFEPLQKFYSERYGEKLPYSCRAFYNSNEEILTLPYLSKSNMILYKNGVSIGNINIVKQLGKGFLKLNNNKNILENIIDTSLQSFWSETILCDEPINIAYSNIRPIVENGVENFYYGTKNGAMCELEFNFETISTVNEISFSPCGQYPMDIIAIRYKASDDPDELLKELISPENIISDRIGTTISSNYSFRFPNVICKKIYILFNQIHYVKNTFVYNTNDAFKNELWNNATNDNLIKPDINKDMLFKPIYLDRGLDDAAWVYINNLIVKNKNLDLKNILLENNSTNKIITKYEYNYGFYNISPNLNNFENIGVYVSTPIYASGNIQSIRIITDESHPMTSSEDYVTDIEYYISCNNNSAYDDWKPILPRNIDIIKCELLQYKDDMYYLRFSAKMLYAIYENEILLTEDIDFTRNPPPTVENPNPPVISINILSPNFSSKYTVTYEPINNSNILNLINNMDETPTISSLETINATNTSCYELKNFPYISTDQMTSTNVKITNKNSGEVVTQNDTMIICVTDPYSSNESYSNFVNTESRLQYYVDKNYIYFSSNISENSEIEVSYNHYVSSVRIKAIFRRNTLKDSWITPVLKKIECEFTTID